MADELWTKALFHLDEGNFSSLEEMLGGSEGFDRQIVEWFDAGNFSNEPEMLAEALSCACMLGRTATASYLIDAGVDPYAGMKTWLAGPHYAVSSGHLDTVEMLIGKNISLEVKNLHGGTLLGQALWSVINEHHDSHPAIIEALIKAGAEVEDGTLEWWDRQTVPDPEAKRRVTEILRSHAEFHSRVEAAKHAVADSESIGSKRALEEAWVRRHIGINHEYAERLTDAEKYYDESLALFRAHASDNDDNYANTVRYPAVIKNRVGKRDESTALWEEAIRRYDEMDQPLGVAEGAAWLTIFAIEKGDIRLANEWLAKAEAAALAANDPDTDKWVAEVKARLDDHLQRPSARQVS